MSIQFMKGVFQWGYQGRDGGGGGVHKKFGCTLWGNEVGNHIRGYLRGILLRCTIGV